MKPMSFADASMGASERGQSSRGSRTSQRNRGAGKGCKKRMKFLLDIFPYRNVLLTHGESSDNVGCLQCRGRAAAAGNFELSGTAGAAGRRDCRGDGTGAAVGVEAFTRVEGRRAGTRAAG